MDLVDEEHVALFEVGDDRGQVAGAFDRGARGDADVDAELARDDVRERGLAESGRPRQQHVVEHFGASARRLDRHPENFFGALLSDEFAKLARAQRQIEPAILVVAARGAVTAVGLEAARSVPRRHLRDGLFFAKQHRQRFANYHFQIFRRAGVRGDHRVNRAFGFNRFHAEVHQRGNCFVGRAGRSSVSIRRGADIAVGRAG